MSRKTSPGTSQAKARARGVAKTATATVARRKPAPPAKPTTTPGKRSEVNDAHDRYANIEVT
jgi:hypothetical protein